MTIDGALNLLLANANPADSDRLTSLLRSASYQVNAQKLESPDALSNALQERDWDLALVSRDDAPVSPRDLLTQMGRLNRDTPVIVINTERDSRQTVEALRMGAADVVSMDDDQVFLAVVSRTLYHLEQLRRERYWQQRCARSEAHCERLVAMSRDAVATIQDGTYVQVNDTYAQLFGHCTQDFMALTPAIDSAAPSFQPALRALLKSTAGNIGVHEQQLDFVGEHVSGQTFTVPATVSPVAYQDEPALQISISAEHLAASPRQAPATTSDDALASIDFFKGLEQIDISARKAIRAGSGSPLFYIRIDQLRPLRDAGELKRAEDLAIVAGQFLATLASNTALLRRIHEDAFVLLCSETTTASSLDYALRLCTATADHIFTVAGKTHTLTLSIGVDLIGSEFTSAETCLDHCIAVITQITSATGGNGARIYQPEASNGLSQLRDEDIARLGQSLLDRELWSLTFQPMVALHGAKRECYEVLARPSRDMPADELPDNFMTRVFATAFAVEIDRWTTLEASRHLIKKFKDHHEIQLFLNLGSMTWTDEKFLPWLKNVIDAAGLTPSNLVFQLAEADVNRDLNRALSFINQIKAMQGLVALSEVGLANPPLALLGKLPVDFIRLNKQLVDRSSKNEVGKDELKQFLNRLKAQDQGIIVPFIGSPAMIPMLWQHGVSYIQGDYIQPPTERMDYDFNDD